MKNTGFYLPEDVISMLQRQHYALFGHSAAKLCHYLKTSLKESDVCYKQKFYGINSHRCLQMTPTSSFCDQKCTYCWRPITPKEKTLKAFDNPEEIIKKGGYV